MKTKNKILILLFSILAFSCDDILEEDISDKIAVIVYPANNIVISSNVVNFQWQEIKGATSYRVQVISDNQNVVLDTLVTETSFTTAILPGHYQWRVRGENFAYYSAYSINASFSLIESDDLRNQQVILSTPQHDFYTKETNITFSWQSIAAAETYTFQLLNVTNGSTLVNQQEELTGTIVSITNAIIIQDAEYKWKVKAVNENSETIFSERTFYLDRVAPNQPSNQLPVNNSTQTINQPINFNWSIAADSGIVQSPITYRIEFSNNENFSGTIQTSDVTNTSFSQSFSNSGDYFWRVIAKDAADNLSSPSTIFKFTIN